MALFNNRIIFKVQGSSVESPQLELNASESGLPAATDTDMNCFCGCVSEGRGEVASMCRLGQLALRLKGTPSMEGRGCRF